MTPAVRQLEKAGVPFRIREYRHDARSDSYGLEAAEALGIPPQCVFKTLLAQVDGAALVVAIVPVSSMLDLKALARSVGAKRAAMAEKAAAERSTGYVLGGISPFGQKKRLTTVIDDAALALAEIHVSGGRRGLEIAIAPADLLRVLDARSAAIASH
jgi:Cys-tRNA(Pro)/Cys-tRNA(Cys) deacylase